MTLTEFEQLVFAAAAASPVCGVPIVRQLTPTSITLRLVVTFGGFIEAFYNEQTGTTAYALIQHGRRTFGADNTGGWHKHPFDDPDHHVPVTSAIPFAQFITEIEQQFAA